MTAESIPYHHTVCQGCGSDAPAVEAGGILFCPNRHCLASGAWNSRMEAGYQNDRGATSPSQALKWRDDLLADLTAAAEEGDPKHLAVMARSARRVAKHLADILPSFADEIRLVEVLADGWDLAEAMRDYFGEEKFEAQVVAGITPDAMAAATIRKHAKGIRAVREALTMLGLTADEMSERWPGRSTLEVAAAMLAHHAGAIVDAERRRREGPEGRDGI